MSYAKVLGATSRQDGYLEGNGYLVSWCVGHLVELAPPNIYDAKYVKWSIADLPILPQKWQYLVSASTKKQFGILQKLMHRPDVESIVNSCDSGREGELIFRLVYEQAGCKKPFSRLWLSSMEETAIREGFAHLKPSTEYDALYNAALCRERADWMVGINASRLFSCLYNQPLAVGRVMPPGACHDGGAGSCHCRLCTGEVLHGRPDSCRRRLRIQQTVCTENGCRTVAIQMPKGGACHGAEDEAQGKVRKSAAAL